MRPTLTALSFLFTVIVSVPFWKQAAAQETSSHGEEAFLPTWKLLKSSERAQFIAGYLYGWRDAAKVTGVAIEFVKENPKDAVDGLTKIQSLYSMEGLKADIVSKGLEEFFAKSENKNATLSQAVTAVRAKLQ